MNKKDLPWIIVLATLVLAWPVIDRRFVSPHFSSPRPAAAPAVSTPAPAAPTTDATSVAPDVPDTATPVLQAAGTAPAELPDETPEATVLLTNDCVELTFSTRGAGLISARLLKFAETLAPDSPRVLLDFSGTPALAYSGLPGLGTDFGFSVQPLENENGLRFERTTATGIHMIRTVTLGDGYLLHVRDSFLPTDASPKAMGPHGLGMGRMSARDGETGMRGLSSLGLDTLSPGSDKVLYWGNKFIKYFAPETKGGILPQTVDRLLPDDGRRLDWAALKEKFFVLILTPEGGAERVNAHLTRQMDPRELTDPNHRAKKATLQSVSADMTFPGSILTGGGDTKEHVFTFYAGPKQYSELQSFAYHQVKVMEFGMWTPICNALIWSLSALHRLIPNYGIAIILLTILIRIIFWPLTHKSGQSMRRMQELQPELAKIKATIKDPQKQQRATLELYKKHKVNPVSGCLPMLIQFPVMIALFYVLRSAIELRFASFLWIHDLSEPENLFPGLLPLVSGLNILPLVMTGVQVLQQKLTPSVGDPAQQKMMTFLPIMMLFLFYSFASGLVLYWTVSQGLMVAQMMMQRQRADHHPKPA